MSSLKYPRLAATYISEPANKPKPIFIQSTFKQPTGNIVECKPTIDPSVYNCDVVPQTPQVVQLEPETPIRRFNRYLESQGYRLEQELGRGANGVTYLGVNKLFPQTPLAIKVIPKDKINSSEIIVLNELKAYCQYHLLCFETYLNDGEYLYIVTKFLAGQDSDRYLFEHPEVNLVDYVDKFITDVLVALTLIHQKNISHDDIKPTNVFYTPEADTFTLIDFGGACPQTCDKIGFTPEYTPPQLLEKYQRGIPRSLDELKNSDLYAVGICIWVLLQIRWGVPKFQYGANLNFTSSEISGRGKQANDLIQMFNMLVYQNRSAGELLRYWDPIAYSSYFP